MPQRAEDAELPVRYLGRGLGGRLCPPCHLAQAETRQLPPACIFAAHPRNDCERARARRSVSARQVRHTGLGSGSVMTSGALAARTRTRMAALLTSSSECPADSRCGHFRSPAGQRRQRRRASRDVKREVGGGLFTSGFGEGIHHVGAFEDAIAFAGTALLQDAESGESRNGPLSSSRLGRQQDSCALSGDDRVLWKHLEQPERSARRADASATCLLFPALCDCIDMVAETLSQDTGMISRPSQHLHPRAQSLRPLWVMRVTDDAGFVERVEVLLSLQPER